MSYRAEETEKSTLIRKSEQLRNILAIHIHKRLDMDVIFYNKYIDLSQKLSYMTEPAKLSFSTLFLYILLWQTICMIETTFTDFLISKLITPKTILFSHFGKKPGPGLKEKDLERKKEIKNVKKYFLKKFHFFLFKFF